jgi:hypothetical protein
MKFTAWVAATSMAAGMAAQAHNRHVHGEGRLDVAIQGQTVQLFLEMPLESALGHERTPRTAAEKAALAAVLGRLRQAQALWQFSSQAACRAQSVEVEEPVWGGEHTDLQAQYLFNCAHPQALQGFHTTMFETFSRLRRLEVQRTGPHGQGGGRLTSQTPSLAWRNP